MKEMPFQRILQSLIFGLFAILLWLAAFPLTTPLPVNMFLRMDPLVFLGTCLSSRTFVTSLWPAVLLLGLTSAIGRFFCSTLCPMGTTIDMADRILISSESGKRKTPENENQSSSRHRNLKYLFLLVLLASAFMGASFVFLGSPLSLITRFYGLIISPILCLFTDTGLRAVRPLANRLDMTFLAYAQTETPGFALQWVTVLIFAGIFAPAFVSPRFWCRNLCPAGALLALFSFRPLIRRQVSDDCTGCGKCRKQCPMNAIAEDPFRTSHRECIACQKCAEICPVQAVSFSFSAASHSASKGEKPALMQSDFSGDRRKLIGAAVSGMGMAAIAMTGLNWRSNAVVPGQILDPALIRPPGSLPEKDFLNRCIRCGECMKACPTNTLQPAGLTAGFQGFFSPVITPRKGACEAHCNTCGQVCPTGAIAPLPLEEKICAKIGTAQILRHKCLAWEFDRKCLVCDEVCPYNAIDLKTLPDQKVPVPFVNESRCAGCGFCEFHCPVQARAAIVIEPMEAIRLQSGSYRQKTADIGLELRIRKSGEKGAFSYGTETENMLEGESGLPPGFTE
ncbi:MAG: 4Fe-4S binding protein [Desulfobacterales bacterium]